MGENKINLEEPGDLYFSVGENEAIIRRVNIPNDMNLDPDKLALFEFIASLPGDERNYFLETYPCDGSGERLAVAYSREIVEKRVSEMKSRAIPPAGFRLRSLAMAAAFTHYCRPMGGEIVCLLDISGEIISYCFLDRQRPIAMGHQTNDYFDLGNEIYDTRRFLTDISAIMQYQLSVLFKGGHTVPLSLVILSGTEATSDLAETVGERLKIRTTLPQFRPELFVNDLPALAHRYFVSLGLTVDI